MPDNLELETRYHEAMTQLARAVRGLERVVVSGGYRQGSLIGTELSHWIERLIRVQVHSWGGRLASAPPPLPAAAEDLRP